MGGILKEVYEIKAFLPYAQRLCSGGFFMALGGIRIVVFIKNLKAGFTVAV